MNDKVKEHLINNEYRFSYDNDNDLFVIPVPVKKWKDKQIVFTCPFCYDKWKLNGTPYKTGRNILHYHGDAGIDKDGNYGLRQPHCQMEAKKYWNLSNYQFKLIGGNMIY